MQVTHKVTANICPVNGPKGFRVESVLEGNKGVCSTVTFVDCGDEDTDETLHKVKVGNHFSLEEHRSEVEEDYFRLTADKAYVYKT